jgi:N-acetylglucosamine repressor
LRIVNEIGNVQLMQKINRLKVLDSLRLKGPAARPEIAKLTGLSPSSITNIISYLFEKKLVTEVGPVESKEVGRKATLIRFNPAAWNIISIDIEIARFNIALTDLDGNIIRIKEVYLDKLLKDYEILNAIKKEISLLITDNGPGTAAMAGIGIAVSGVTKDDEKLVISTSLKWRGLSLKEYFEKSFGILVYVQNNSRTKAISELRKSGRELGRNIIFLDLSVGVGIINFFEQRINDAVMGEFGHTTVKKDGPLCFCGNRGCLELMCSEEAVIEQCSERLRAEQCLVLADILKEQNVSLSYDSILEADTKGDKDVHDILRECGEYLGIGIANIINIFNPDKIIINGDALLKSEFIYQTAIAEVHERAYEHFTPSVKIEKVNVTDEQAIKGVSLYVADKLFDLSGPEL